MRRWVFLAILFIIWLTVSVGEVKASQGVYKAKNRAPKNSWEVNAVANPIAGCSYAGLNYHFNHIDDKFEPSHMGWDRPGVFNMNNVIGCNSNTYLRAWFTQSNANPFHYPNAIEVEKGQQSVDIYAAFSMFVTGYTPDGSQDNYRVHYTNIKPSTTALDMHRATLHLTRTNKNGGFIERGRVSGKGFINPRHSANDGSFIRVSVDLNGLTDSTGKKTLSLGIHLCNAGNTNGYGGQIERESYNRTANYYVGGRKFHCDDFNLPVTFNIKEPKKWQGESKTSADKQVARPNDSINFEHKVWSEIENKVGTDVDWEIRVDNKAVKSGKSKQDLNEFVSEKYSYKIKNSEVGKSICSQIFYKPGHLNMSISNKNGQRAEGDGAISAPACVYIPYEYELKPCVNSGGEKCGGEIYAEPEEKVDISGVINKENGDNPPDYTKYLITSWIIPKDNEGNPTTSKEELKDSGDADTCVVYNSSRFYNGSARNCKSEYYNGEDFKNPFPEVPASAQVGERYCVALSVSPYKLTKNQDENTQKNAVLWRHSSPICILVVRKPKLQIWNNGIFSRGGIQTSRVNKNGQNFGSWVEYEAISNGEIARFGSEGSVLGTNLSFSNNSKRRGDFGANNFKQISQIINQIESKFGSSAKEDPSRGLIVERYTGKYDLTTASIPENLKTVVIYGDGIRISKNINYSKVGQQVIIVANNIHISPEVENIDAWLIARNSASTCSNGFASSENFVNIENCGRKLVVNGAVLTGQLKSYRAFGENNSNAPAEIYNQRPDMYLWSLKNFVGDAYFKTTYNKELPVRY
ncbi:MAG: hypothetical protein Q4A21_03180 [bacterium]|nr:hypothetical protein [bacterium]